MRVRDHIALSSGAAAVLYPFLRGSVVTPWAASIFIDVDHYLWFLVRHRRLNPAAAVRAFNDANAPRHPATRPLHHPGAVLLLLLLGRRRRAAMLIATGMAFHIGLDSYHRMRMADAQAAVLKRDQLTCRVCGSQGVEMTAHVWRQPALLPSYRLDHLVTVCAGCHAAAHTKGAVAIVRPRCGWESYRDGVARRARRLGKRCRRSSRLALCQVPRGGQPQAFTQWDAGPVAQLTSRLANRKPVVCPE
jgi:hypothetical protein